MSILSEVGKVVGRCGMRSLGDRVLAYRELLGVRCLLKVKHDPKQWRNRIREIRSWERNTKKRCQQGDFAYLNFFFFVQHEPFI